MSSNSISLQMPTKGFPQLTSTHLLNTRNLYLFTCRISAAAGRAAELKFWSSLDHRRVKPLFVPAEKYLTSAENQGKSH